MEAYLWGRGSLLRSILDHISHSNKPPLVVCSGVLALYEFRLNPMAQTERGEWTGRRLFYTLVFTIGFFVGFIYILTGVF